MLAHEVRRSLKTVSARNELALALEEIDQTLRRQVLCRAGVEARLSPKIRRNIGEQTGASVRFASLQHHLNYFVSVDWIHAHKLPVAQLIQQSKPLKA